ncbi:MAG: chromate transporter, partial [Parabacteroides sp.]|nr:chromate transporter [Parabacteroides sp.]
GILTFGGGKAMLSMLKREVVDKKKWANETELLDIYAIGQCTPGVIAVNTSTYIGYEQYGIPGAIAGTLGMVSPSIIIISLIAAILEPYMTNPIVLHALSGIRIVVCALMFNTVLTMAKAGIMDKLGVFLFLTGFMLATFSPVPTVLIVIAAAVIGIVVKQLTNTRQLRGGADQNTCDHLNKFSELENPIPTQIEN